MNPGCKRFGRCVWHRRTCQVLAERGFVVDGLDLDAAFVRVSRKKHPSVDSLKLI